MLVAPSTTAGSLPRRKLATVRVDVSPGSRRSTGTPSTYEGLTTTTSTPSRPPAADPRPRSHRPLPPLVLRVRIVHARPARSIDVGLVGDVVAGGGADRGDGGGEPHSLPALRGGGLHHYARGERVYAPHALGGTGVHVSRAVEDDAAPPQRSSHRRAIEHVGLYGLDLDALEPAQASGVAVGDADRVA